MRNGEFRCHPAANGFFVKRFFVDISIGQKQIICDLHAHIYLLVNLNAINLTNYWGGGGGRKPSETKQKKSHTPQPH